MRIKSNHEIEKQDLKENLNRNDKDLKLLIKRNSELEKTLENLRKKQKEIKRRFKDNITIHVNDEEAQAELNKNLKSSFLQQNLEKMKNISTSLLNEKEEEYQREMRRLKLTMENIDRASLSKNKTVHF